METACGWLGLLLLTVGLSLLILDCIINGPRYREEQERVAKMIDNLKLYNNPHQYGTVAWFQYERWWWQEGRWIAEAHNERLREEHRRWCDEQKRKGFFGRRHRAVADGLR